MRAAGAVVLALGALVYGPGAGGTELRPPPGASSCTGCHGEGAAMGALAGRPEAEIVAALEGFRSGARPSTLMTRIAKGFDEAESRALAAWFAGQGAR